MTVDRMTQPIDVSQPLNSAFLANQMLETLFLDRIDFM